MGITIDMFYILINMFLLILLLMGLITFVITSIKNNSRSSEISTLKKSNN